MATQTPANGAAGDTRSGTSASTVNRHSLLARIGVNMSRFAEYVKANKSAIKQAAADSVDLSRLYRLTLTCVSQNPALQQCTLQSVFRAMQQAAEVGLEPSSALGECYLVPYKDNAQLIIGYRGLITLARRSGEVETIQAFCVYEGDDFDVALGLNPVLYHKPLFGDSDPRRILYAYAVARLRGGVQQFDVMTRAEIERIMARSRAATNGPWVTDFAEMAKKTVVRRLCKMLPMSIQMAKAVEYDHQAELDEINGAVVIQDIRPASDSMDEGDYRRTLDSDPFEQEITEGETLLDASV